jgi:hypothetical protein
MFRPPRPSERALAAASVSASPLPAAKPVIAALQPASDDESGSGAGVSGRGSSGTATGGGGAIAAAVRLVGVVIHVATDHGIIVDGEKGILSPV